MSPAFFAERTVAANASRFGPSDADRSPTPEPFSAAFAAQDCAATKLGLMVSSSPLSAQDGPPIASGLRVV